MAACRLHLGAISVRPDEENGRDDGDTERTPGGRAADRLDPAAVRYQGWVARTRSYDPARRVDLLYEDFVVVLALGLNRDGALRANFITCFQADNSVAKIRTSPLWTREACLNALR